MAGHGMDMVMLDDLARFVDSAAARGLGPATREAYDHGVRKVVLRDPDGNEIGFGGLPSDTEG